MLCRTKWSVFFTLGLLMVGGSTVAGAAGAPQGAGMHRGTAVTSRGERPEGRETRSYERREGERGETRGRTTAHQVVNVNTASMARLRTLPNVGPLTAQSIMRGRPYHDAAQFQAANRRYISPQEWQRMSRWVRF